MTTASSQDNVFSHKRLRDQQAVKYHEDIKDLLLQYWNYIAARYIVIETKCKDETQETHASFIDIDGTTSCELHGFSLFYGYKSIFFDEAVQELKYVAYLGVHATDIAIFDNKAANDPLVFIGPDRKLSKQLSSGTTVRDSFEKGILDISNKSEAKYNKQFYLLTEMSNNSFCFPHKMPSKGLHLASKINTPVERKYKLQHVMRQREEEIDTLEYLAHEDKLTAEQCDTSSLSDYYNQHSLRCDTFSKALQFKKCVETLRSISMNSQVEEGVMQILKTQSISLESAALFIGCTRSGFFLMLMSGILNKALRDCYRNLKGLICILESQDDAQQSILEKAGEKNTTPKTYSERYSHHISLDSSFEPSTDGERVAVTKKDTFFELKNVKALENQTLKLFPKMITVTDLDGNDFPRPYGVEGFSNNQISADTAQQEASQKQLYQAKVTLVRSAEATEDSSNQNETTSTSSSSREDSMSAPRVDTHSNDLRLDVTPPNSLICDQTEHYEIPAENEMFTPAMNVEQTKPPATLCTSTNEKESHSVEINIDSAARKTDCLSQSTSFDDFESNDILLEEVTEDLQSSVHNTETDTEQSANTFVCPDSLPVENVEQFSDSASNALHFSAPVQAQSPENYGLLYESWSQPESLNKSDNQCEPERTSSSSPTLSAYSYQNPADDTACKTLSAMESKGVCEREDPCLVPDSLRPIHSVLSTNGTADDDQDEVQYRRMERDRSIIAQPTEEESQPSIVPSTADRPFSIKPVNYTICRALANSQFTSTFGACPHSSLASSGCVSDRGLQLPLIVHAAGSRPPKTFTDPDFLDISQARNPEYSDLRARRATYDRTWDLMDSEADPVSMALAGFFRPDPQRPRCVRCFYCGLELDFDGPSGWEEHLRHSPSCRYLRVMGGEQFVREQQIRRTRK